MLLLNMLDQKEYKIDNNAKAHIQNNGLQRFDILDMAKQIIPKILVYQHSRILLPKLGWNTISSQSLPWKNSLINFSIYNDDKPQ